MQVKKQQLEPGVEQWTGSKLGKKYVKAVYCYPAYSYDADYIMRNARLDEVQAGSRKGRGTRDQIISIVGSYKKQGNSKETSTSVSLTTLKPLTVWIITNCRKFLKR